MKKGIIVLFLLVASFGNAQNWKSNLEEAKTQAATENKDILLVFSGSDWCGPCMKLEKNVWKSDAFKKESEKKWVLLRADFPKKKANQLSAELTENNKKLAAKYNKGGSFPLVVLLDKTGKPLGMTGFKNVSAEDYIEIIKALKK